MKLQDYSKQLAYAYMALYATIVFAYARVPISVDDWDMFNLITHGGMATHGWGPDIGRFFPAAYLDVNLLSRFSSNPYLFFGFNAFTVIVGLWLMYNNIMRVQSDRIVALALLVVISLQPGFALASTAICYPERMQFLAIALCFHFLLNVLDHVRREHDQSNASRFNAHISTTSVSPSSPYTGGGGGLRSLSVSNIVLCALFANYAIYLKEPTFIFFGVLSVMILFLRRSRGLDSLNVLGIVLLISSVVFIGLYGILIYPNIDPDKIYNGHIYKQGGQYKVMLMLKVLLENIIQNNFVMTGIIITACMYLFVRSNTHLLRDDKHIIAMSIATASIMVVLGFVTAKAVSMYYYLSTSYFYLAIPVAMYFNITRFTRAVAVVGGAMYLVSTCMYAMNVLTIQKGYSVAYFDTVSFLKQHLKEREGEGKDVSIFFDGYARDDMHSGLVSRWAHFLGESNYYIETYYKNDGAKRPVHDGSRQLNELQQRLTHMPYFSSLETREPTSGDLIVYDFYSHNTDAEELKKKYELIFESRFIGVPNVGLRSLMLKAIQMLRGDVYNTMGANPNVFKLPMAIYVFRAR